MSLCMVGLFILGEEIFKNMILKFLMYKTILNVQNLQQKTKINRIESKTRSTT